MEKKKKKRRERVPNTLWQIYNHQARTLSSTLISLIPPQCACNARSKCLRCVFGSDDDAALSYLVTPLDPPDYRKLLKSCFVVVPNDAPPLPSLLSFTQLWSQSQIFERTIQALMNKKTTASNVICHGYQKLKLRCSAGILLTTSAWDLALQRVGDSVMAYLLMHTLIFMQIKHNAHQQVAGPPVNQMVARFPRNVPMSNFELSTRTRCPRKRRRGNEDSFCEEPPCKLPFRAIRQHLYDSVGPRNEDHAVTFCSEVSTQSQSPETSSVTAANRSQRLHCDEEKSIENLKGKSGKRYRLPSWQRRKRCKGLIQHDSYTREPSIFVLDNEDALHKIYEPCTMSNQGQGQVLPTSDKIRCNQEEPARQLLCPCCSVFQSMSRLPKDAQIDRKSTFYSSKCSSLVFLEGHILNWLKPDVSGTTNLLQHILGLSMMDISNLPASCLHKQGLCPYGSSCLYHSFFKLVKVLLRRYRRCQHIRLIEKHCSSHLHLQCADKYTCSTLQDFVSESVSSKKDVNQGLDDSSDCVNSTAVIQRHFGLNQPYCSTSQVVSFVWAVCRSIIPPDLLGVSSNRRILKKNISRFINLRRFEKFSLKQCLYKLELPKFPFLSRKESFGCLNVSAKDSEAKEISGLETQSSNHIQCHTLKQTLLERWIYWLFARFVVPLVQANFYVTESEHGKQNIYYYQKSVWEKLSDGITRMLKDQSYQSLDNASVAEILRKRSFGFSKLRLCPKETGARPIANLKAPSRFWVRGSRALAQQLRKQRKGRCNSRIYGVSYFKSVNAVLRDVHIVFKDLKLKEPERWGSTVFCYSDIYKKLCPFLRHLKDGQASMPPVYLVVADVQKAFDTVRHDKLLSVLNELEMADRYTLQKSSEIFWRKKSLYFSGNTKLMTQYSNSRAAEAMTTVHRRTFHTVAINQEQTRTVRREELQLYLKEHLKNNVLKLGKNFFLQTVGIPQGSVLSTLLCTMYYGHLERNVLYPYLERSSSDMLHQDHTGGVPSPKYLLLRFVDDFLFISTSEKQANSFFSRIRRGFREYNCHMNQEKFCTNFVPGSFLKPGSRRLLAGSDGFPVLQWSGLLINSCTLEVQADYSRYLNDHLSSTLTVSWQPRPVRQLKTKLRAYMRPKCHPIFFDATINSPATIKLNVYQAFVVCAMKFHCYVRELSRWCTLQSRYHLTSVEGSLRYMYKLMKQRMIKVNPTCRPILQVSKKEVICLGLTAYVQVLSKKQSRHKELLQSLRAKLSQFSRIRHSPDMEYAVAESHSALLWKIKY